MGILITGGTGWIGQKFRKVYPDAIWTNDKTVASVVSCLDVNKLDTIINCAGYVGKPNVDDCENHPIETYEANTIFPVVLAKLCQERYIKLVHISSGCIYSGYDKEYAESDEPDYFGSVYSRSKILAEEVLIKYSRCLILRLRMPFDDTPHPRNLLTKLLSYKILLNKQNSLTYLPEFIKIAKNLIDNKWAGTYNIVNPGSISPYEIRQLLTPREVIHSIDDIHNRSNCILRTAHQLPGKLSPVKDAIKKAYEAYKSTTTANK